MVGEGGGGAAGQNCPQLRENMLGHYESLQLLAEGEVIDL